MSLSEVPKLAPEKWQRVVLALMIGLSGGFALERWVVAPREHEALARCQDELKPRDEVQVVFHELDIDSQVIGGGAPIESMVGKLRYDIGVNGTTNATFTSRVRL